jgi:hypothetical protein
MTNEEPTVRDTLAACGLLKFFECPLVQAQEYLLQFLIQMWSLDLHCFMVQGEKLAFTAVEDVYFLTGLPFRGTPLPTEPVVPGDGQLVTLGRRYCMRDDFMSGSVVSIGAMDALVHRCVAAMVVRVYGSLATQWISGGQLRIMERALVGKHFSWGLMLHAKMVGQLDRCRMADTWEFAFGSILVAWFLERVPMLHPRVLLGAPGVREPQLKWWSRIMIHHSGGEGGHYFTTEAAQVWRQCRRSYCSIRTMGWTSGMIQRWCYLQERCSTPR